MYHKYIDMPDKYYKPVGHNDYGAMGPFNEKKTPKRKVAGEGPFGTVFQTKKPVVNDVKVVKRKRG